MNTNYCNKYNPDNKALATIFGNHYQLIHESGVVSNIVAVSGSDLERYLEYFTPMMSKVKRKPTFAIIEDNKERYKDLCRRLKRLQKSKIFKYQQTANHTVIGYGSIFNYEHVTISGKHKELKPARIEDLGTGQKITKLIRCAIPRLDVQAHSPQSNFSNRYKVQILDGARKFAHDEKVVKLLRDYLSIVDTDLISINGKRIDTSGQFFSNGIKIAAFVDPVRNGHTVTVYKHIIKFKTSRKHLIFNLYTYINGGMMLSSILIYK